MKKYFFALCLLLFTAVTMFTTDNGKGERDVGDRFQSSDYVTVSATVNGINLENYKVGEVVWSVDATGVAEVIDVGSINQFETVQPDKWRAADIPVINYSTTNQNEQTANYARWVDNGEAGNAERQRSS